MMHAALSQLGRAESFCVEYSVADSKIINLLLYISQSYKACDFIVVLCSNSLSS